MTHKIIKIDDYLLVVDESEIKMDDYYLDDTNSIRVAITEAESYWTHRKKYKKLIAHLPLNGSPILEGVDLLAPIDDDVTKLAIDCYTEGGKYGLADDTMDIEVPYFIAGYNKAKEKYNNKLKEIIMQFDLEIKKHLLMYSIEHSIHGKMCDGINEIRSSILQSLHQYPTEFECEMIQLSSNESFGLDYGSSNLKPKTITTTKGIQWVGQYK